MALGPVVLLLRACVGQCLRLAGAWGSVGSGGVWTAALPRRAGRSRHVTGARLPCSARGRAASHSGQHRPGCLLAPVHAFPSFSGLRGLGSWLVRQPALRLCVCLCLVLVCVLSPRAWVPRFLLQAGLVAAIRSPLSFMPCFFFFSVGRGLGAQVWGGRCFGCGRASSV